jgi:hypothetical protein
MRFVCYLYRDDDDGYTVLQTNNRRIIFYLQYTRERNCCYVLYIYMYMPYLSCSDAATEIKRVLCRNGILQWEGRERRRKTGNILLAPIIEHFHVILLTSDRCTWSSNREWYLFFSPSLLSVANFFTVYMRPLTSLIHILDMFFFFLWDTSLHM